MGISLEQWRQRIGTFSQPVRCSSPIPTIKLRAKYLSLGIRILLFLMLVTQDVESNPGPGSSNSEGYPADHIESQSYGRGGGRGRGTDGWGRGNRGNGRGSGRGQNQAMRDLVESVRHERRITRSQSERISQPPITSWLGVAHQSRAGAGNSLSGEQSGLQSSGMANRQVEETEDSDTDTELQMDREHDINRERDRNSEMASGGSLEDRGDRADDLDSSGGVKDLLLDIRREMRYMNRKFDKLETTMTSLKKDNKTLKKQNKQLTKKVEELSSSVQDVTEVAKQNERKNGRLESQSR